MNWNASPIPPQDTSVTTYAPAFRCLTKWHAKFYHLTRQRQSTLYACRYTHLVPLGSQLGQNRKPSLTRIPSDIGSTRKHLNLNLGPATSPPIERHFSCPWPTPEQRSNPGCGVSRVQLAPLPPSQPQPIIFSTTCVNERESPNYYIEKVCSPSFLILTCPP